MHQGHQSQQIYNTHGFTITSSCLSQMVCAIISLLISFLEMGLHKQLRDWSVIRGLSIQEWDRSQNQIESDMEFREKKKDNIRRRSWL